MQKNKSSAEADPGAGGGGGGGSSHYSYSTASDMEDDQEGANEGHGGGGGGGGGDPIHDRDMEVMVCGFERLGGYEDEILSPEGIGGSGPRGPRLERLEPELDAHRHTRRRRRTAHPVLPRVEILGLQHRNAEVP